MCHTPSRPLPTHGPRTWRPSVQGIVPAGRLTGVHGSHPTRPPSWYDRPELRRVDLVDVALVGVPVLVVILAFLLASIL